MTTGGDRKIVFALMGITALCLIGLGASLYRSKVGQLARRRHEAAEKQEQLEQVRSKLTRLPSLEVKYARLQGQLSVLEPALPDSAYIPTFLRQIERLASATQNRILMIRPKAPTGRSGAQATSINEETGEIVQGKSQPGAASPAPPPALPYDFIPLELRLEGTYWTVMAYLKELQRFPKMIAVNDIAFSPNQAGGTVSRSPQLTATMELTAVVTKKGDKNGKSA